MSDNHTAAADATSHKWETIRHRLAEVQERIEQGNRLTPEEQRAILKARAQQLARVPLATDQDAPALEIVEFRMAHEIYGIESRFVREVFPLREVCPLPCTPAFVLGLINVRGQLLSVLDLKRFFGLAAQELDNHNQAIILHNTTLEVGILADSLLNVRKIARAALQTDLPTLTGVRQEFLLGITPERVIVLDAEKLLASRAIIVYEEVDS